VKIDQCVFPEDIFYDTENFVWAKLNHDETVTIGITAILASIAGRLSTIKLKQIGTDLEKGKIVGTIEGIKYFGVIRTPIKGRIAEINKAIISRPKLVNDFPYTEGWIMKIIPSDINDLTALDVIENCHSRISSTIKELHVRCFAEFPDHEMFEIGVECAATLTKLDELMTKISNGEVVHLVSDDSTADFEIYRWANENKQSLLETRREGNLFHFIIKKTK
jgi:glycine cleavage system H lipoate-binding protein/TusA-related sulfurtransferase